MTHEIDLGGGLVARVDDEDAPLVAGRRWRAARSGKIVYAVSGYGTNRVLMHRLILGLTGEEIADHANGDGLDNRQRANLRECSQKENMRNRNKWQECTSPFKGVIGEVDRNHWRAEICPEGERLRLGVFKSEHAAARAYDRAARLMYGRFARTNEMLGLFSLHPDRTRTKRRMRRINVAA